MLMMHEVVSLQWLRSEDLINLAERFPVDLLQPAGLQTELSLDLGEMSTIAAGGSPPRRPSVVSGRLPPHSDPGRRRVVALRAAARQRLPPAESPRRMTLSGP